jgi:hypothetical protein
MPISKHFKDRARFLVIEEIKPNHWVLRVFDPRRSGGTIPIERIQVRNMTDVRRIARIYMNKHRIIRELIFHDIDELVQYFKAEKQPLPETVKSEVIAQDTEEDTGEDNADDTDERAPEVHGAGGAILARPASQAE